MPAIVPESASKFIINLPEPEERQAQVLDHAARFKMVAAGRRWGKTTTGLVSAVIGHGPTMPNGEPMFPGAIYGKKIWWVAPTYTTLTDIWRALKFALQGAIIEKNENEHRIGLPNGGSITVRSTESYDNLRGSGVDGMLLDEAAYIDRRAWVQVLRPMLADRQGWAIFMSTPKGRNWWYNLYERVPDMPNWERWKGVTTDNPKVTPEELEDIRSDPEMTDHDFAQEYLAEFTAPGANDFKEEWLMYYVFDEIEQQVHLYDVPPSEPNAIENIRIYDKHELFIFGTADLAISKSEKADFTVFQIWAVTPKNDLLLMHQVRDRMDNPTQLETLHALNYEYEPSYFGIESVAYQEALVQQALASGLPVRKLTAAKDKEIRAQSATTRMAARKVFFNEGHKYWPILKEEILGFPHTKFDDQVDALSYASILLGQRPRKMLITRQKMEEFKSVFHLFDYTDHTKFPEHKVKHDPDPTLFRMTDHGKIVEAKSVQTLMDHVSPAFYGAQGELWHVHLALSPYMDYGAISLARISRWDSVVDTIDNIPYVIEVPFYEVPFTLKVTSALDKSLSIAILSDFIIALKRIRNFNITTASITGVNSATTSQKLGRAGIIVEGLKINPETLLPSGTNRESTNSKTEIQPYNDLVTSMETGRIAINSLPYIQNELAQLDERGKTLAGEATAAESVACSVGFLARFGHQTMEPAMDELVSLEQAGFEPFTGINNFQF